VRLEVRRGRHEYFRAHENCDAGRETELVENLLGVAPSRRNFEEVNIEVVEEQAGQRLHGLGGARELHFGRERVEMPVQLPRAPRPEFLRVHRRCAVHQIHLPTGGDSHSDLSE